MSDVTPNLALPLLAAAQAQKHVTHNEALTLIDALVQIAVESMTQGSPPPTAAEGTRYIVGSPATGDWSGRGQSLAILAGGAWIFQSPRAGYVVFDKQSARLMLFDGTAWQPAASGGGGAGGGTAVVPTTLDRLGINTTANDSQRFGVQALGAFFTHDAAGDHQVQINRQAPSSTGTIVYSTNWSGRAETGCAGSDDYRIKVSADGSAWRDALVVDAASGRVRFPQGLQQLSRAALAASSDIHMTQAGATAFADLGVTAGRLYLAPVIPPVRRTFERLAIRVTLALAGQARLGLYDDTGEFRPGALVADLGTVDTGTAGLKVLALTRELDDRPYWLAAVFSSACRVMGGQGTVVGVSAAASLASAVAVCGLYRAFAFGALPLNESPASHLPATSTIGCPLFYLR